MKTTLQFLPPISKVVGLDSFSINADTYEDIVSAIKVLFKPILHRFSNIFILDSDKLITYDMLKFSVSTDRIIIGPLITGGASGMDSIGNLQVLYGSSSTMSNQAVALTGLAKRVTESSLFGQGQTAFDLAQRRLNRADGTLEGNEDPTTGFGSIASTSGLGLPVPLHFGLVRTSGALINNFVKHIQRGGIDNIRVVDYV
jgi:hypothetical protein